MAFGSLFHLGSVLLVLLATAIIFLLLRNRSHKLQKISILTVMLLNTLQHLFKFLIYPPYYGTGFSIYSTAYNVCAVLILSAPVVFLWGNRFWKNFLYFIGTVAGIGTTLFPYWVFGTPIAELGWNYYRFYICHGLLFVSCALPLLLGFHRPRYQEFWQVGLGFLLTLCVILVNNVIFMTVGLYPQGQGRALYDQLLNINPCMMIAPKEDFIWLKKILEIGSADVFLGNNPAGRYAPILWYAVPVYVGISLASFGIFVLLDRKKFRESMKKH